MAHMVAHSDHDSWPQRAVIRAITPVFAANRINGVAIGSYPLTDGASKVGGDDPDCPERSVSSEPAAGLHETAVPVTVSCTYGTGGASYRFDLRETAVPVTVSRTFAGGG